MVTRKIDRRELQYDHLFSQIDPERLPAHVAVIMDGNGRWAARRGLPRVAGHRAGATAVRETVETCARLGIGHLTLYAFSTENWKRPALEIEALWGLLREYLRKELRTLQRNGIRVQAIGRREALPEEVREEIARAEAKTAANTGLRLNVALNYSGRAELVDACRRLVEDALRGRIGVEEIDERALAERLYTAELPDPDLLIRTSGELRVSNFLLWQIAYSEIYVTPTLWPDFDRIGLLEALLDYQRRERRFGAIQASPGAMRLEAR